MSSDQVGKDSLLPRVFQVDSSRSGVQISPEVPCRENQEQGEPLSSSKEMWDPQSIEDPPS